MTPCPRYAQLADLLRRAVSDGTYALGSRLPSVRVLAVDYGVATATAAKAVDVLKREGIAVGRRGIGTVVREVPDAWPPGRHCRISSTNCGAG